MTSATMGIMDRLREGTKTLHDAAEGHAFQRSLFAGQLPRDSYIEYLGQMFCMYQALESALRESQSRRREVADVVRPYNYRTEDLRADLAHLGRDSSQVQPFPSTQETIRTIQHTLHEHPLALLGMHYVLEGSNNGNHFIAKNVRKAYGLDQAGTRFLDPYGEAQRPRWAEYKQALGAVKLTDDESDRMLAAAQQMFRAIGRISQELDAARQP